MISRLPLGRRSFFQLTKPWRSQQRRRQESPYGRRKPNLRNLSQSRLDATCYLQKPIKPGMMLNALAGTMEQTGLKSGHALICVKMHLGFLCFGLKSRTQHQSIKFGTSNSIFQQQKQQGLSGGLLRGGLNFQLTRILVSIPERQQVNHPIIHYPVIQDNALVDHAFMHVLLWPVQWI